MKITRTLRNSDYFTELDKKNLKFISDLFTNPNWILNKPEQKHTKTYYYTRYVVTI